ncbi:MAG: BlaI/MecI/CopY family transcriptional regulator [Planctomycetota bacterium]
MTTRSSRPTEFELELLKILWDRGPATAREILEAIEERRPVGYTTVLKMLQLMEKKDMVAVDRTARSHVYSAALERGRTLGGLVEEFVSRAFDGAAEDMLVHLVKGRLDAEALERLQRRLEELKEEENRG